MTRMPCLPRQGCWPPTCWVDASLRPARLPRTAKPPLPRQAWRAPGHRRRVPPVAAPPGAGADKGGTPCRSAAAAALPLLTLAALGTPRPGRQRRRARPRPRPARYAHRPDRRRRHHRLRRPPSRRAAGRTPRLPGHRGQPRRRQRRDRRSGRGAGQAGRPHPAGAVFAAITSARRRWSGTSAGTPARTSRRLPC